MGKKSKEEKSLTLTVISGLFWKFSERILAQVISFIVSIVLARILAPDDYGAVAIVMIFISFADVLATSGFSSSLIQKKNADELDFNSVFYCSLVLSVVLYFVMFMVAPLIADFYGIEKLTLVIRVFSLRIPLAAFNSIQHAYVSRHMIFKKFFFSTLIGTLISAGVGIALALKGFGVWALIAQYMTNSIIDSIVLALTIHWHPRLMFSWQRSKKLLSYGWKVLATEFSGVFFNQLKGLLIGKAYSTADLAYYNRGNALVGLATDNVRTTVMSVLFPAMSNIEEDRKRMKDVSRRCIRVMAYVILPAAIGMSIIAEPLITLLLTEKWLPAIFFLRVAAISTSVEMIGHISLQCLKAIGRTDLILRNEIINKPPFIAALVIGMNTSVEVLCLSLLVTSLFGTFINVAAYKKCVGYKYREIASDLLNPFFPCMAMSCLAILSIIMPVSLLLKVIIAIILGAAGYIAASAITKNESFGFLLGIVKRFKK